MITRIHIIFLLTIATASSIHGMNSDEHEKFVNTKIEACMDLSLWAAAHENAISSHYYIALLVGQALINTPVKNVPSHLDTYKEQLMSTIAYSFIKNSKNIFGDDVTHSNALTCLQQRAQTEKWWDVRATEENGCGSLLHAFPFGVAFYKLPQTAADLAAEHSKITHGGSAAQAACAALASAVARSIEISYTDDNFTEIIATMKTAALSHPQTATKINDAYNAAKNQTELFLHDNCTDNADDVLCRAVYFFTLSQQCANEQDIITLLQHVQTVSPHVAYVLAALVGAYFGPLPSLNLEITLLKQNEEILCRKAEKQLRNRPSKREKQLFCSAVSVYCIFMLFLAICIAQEFTN